MSLTEEESAQMRRAASSRYNSRNREVRNQKTKARMARLRAAEKTLPKEEQAARKEARVASARRYREKNRARLAEEAAWYRGRAEMERKDAKKRAELKKRKVDGRVSRRRTGRFPWGKGSRIFRPSLISLFNEAAQPLCRFGRGKFIHLSAKSKSALHYGGLYSPSMSSTNESYYPPAPISPDVEPPSEFRPCAIPDHVGTNFTDHIDFTRLGNKKYWILFWPKTPAGMYSLKADVLAAAMQAGTAAASPAVLQSYKGWREVWAAWAQHCWVRHTRCAHHPQACCDGDCPSHPPPANPEVVKVAKRRVKREVDDDDNEPTPRVKSEAPSASAPAKRKAARSPPTSDDDAGSYKAPLYDPDTPPARHPSSRLRGETQSPDDDTVSASAAGAAAPEGGRRAQPVRRIEDLRAAYAGGSGGAASIGASSAARSSSASAVPSSATPSSASSLSASTATAAADVGGTAAWMRGLDGEALRVVLRDDPFFVSVRGIIWHSRREAFDAVGEGPVQVVVGWDAATELAVELARKYSEVRRPGVSQTKKTCLCRPFSLRGPF
ncbi:hypothetical protein C8F04DRAFT_1186931 [Mycena alexandri]|uniref:Uncharacterized protein n=1 Tax=Mycena alexandri TaxID=1745969 RepID=A0AAD6SPR2_9AGAR|nr:hypothetical protein C8F04DRAFT_1186931 [Mycena alexandri]